MNILLTTETYLPYITGVSVSTDNIARFMLGRGHKVTLVYPEPIVKSEAIYPKGLTRIKVPSIPFAFYNNYAFAYPFAAHKIINDLIKTGNFDIVHAQETGTIGLNAQALAIKYGVPTVGSLHFIPQQIDRVLSGGLEPALTPLINVLVKHFANKYDQIMTVSNFFANYLRSVGVTKPINIISNGVDTNLFKPGKVDYKTREKYGLKKDDVVFFYLGRLDRDKNVETLVRAMPGTVKNVRIIIVGRGTQKDYLHGLTKSLNVEDKIVWVDYITNEEMTKIYHAVDAFVIMSPYEGQSIVTLQAVATGLPVIAANAGALPELVQNNVNGYLVKTYASNILAGRMNALAESKSLREKFGRQSRKISLEHERSKALAKLEKIYFDLQK